MFIVLVSDVTEYLLKSELKMEDRITDSSQNNKQLLDKICENDNAENKDAKKTKNKNDHLHICLLVCIIGVSLGILLEIINTQTKNRQECIGQFEKPKYWVYSAFSDVDNRNGLLKHVHLVLGRLGYEKSTNESNWSLLWSHDYPFRVLYPNLHRLKSHQKVNHFPGTGFITNKVDLATSDSKFIPRAFKLPQNKEDFIKYANENKNALFLEKHNQHRGVFLKNVTEIDLSSGESFVQEYVQKPFLVDGHKFDIGVYVVLTSVNPLRVYWYKGDVLFRYCPAKYHPFDPKNLDKYVVGDDYLPTWEVPSLAQPYTALGFGMKDVFDIYAQSKGKDTSKMWEDVQKAIVEVFINKEKHIIEALKNYPSGDNFFELMRFDLVVDEDLKVYLLEANMSPNLSSAHYPPNQLLYEQVLYNLYSLTGVARNMNGYNNHNQRDYTASQNMMSSQKNIAVWGEECSNSCKDNCDQIVCGLCKPCLSHKLRSSLLRANAEHLHRGDFGRIFPPAMKPHSLIPEEYKNLSEHNHMQYLWFQGKCNKDENWCS
ncbi:probable tubulin polyglutamylase ttll-15 [Amyelois transitella]|uniref:probable tubulin polyglutamylase ttll-15 n=1 Tax=Amyelois transitella TaxID=680683 RepID=UPI0029908082|nr:probable tubulin polyglutamylase ttll-15 [Amyelois transitella]